ncbi:MAG: molecular chaperone DnaK [Candidatus Zambryskibacteria bacterium RIFCSPHIGHO2_12_FULL_48_10]|uniref:Chaperone protein DnaK n=1 Tax=Candidatus Zambryskibacteria bacterium RIFCSPHIGHO2_01_FULL_46_25 TaxID=1802738 RepID=A0A1G2SYY2_9BACT|nr:MAG: Chaperone protein DnaK [Parcubacteria group bacterium GW2011_GWA1_47_10]OHA90250.1 MAG: molecular chaperone DnaK [Candidatus Zambryskibacteria bacterium RIFCSPHIGHO2_01_FULL_46_25]OHB02595.1 MAG: molecular chaperone DnaK [Candidatus Zambryskibacteria bacterium RIFCSPHIGHO2_12_FULL_48_10]OHB06788.1 MAG: molecular chaperone DnaK [Candidatus Zambryskibacteria bacterium RIFCSPLOWO2_01_FULL_48_25]
MAKIIGIDLGTTFSAVAVVEAGNPKILENAEGARTTPSIVAISKTGERLVGLLAKRQAVTNPKNTIFGIKRFIGHTYADPAVQKDKVTVPFELKEGANGGVMVKIGDKDNRPEEISAMILQKLKVDAETRLGEKVTEAVITVPAYFNDSQRQATKDAGQIAGLNVLRIINEPTAAALAYGFNKKKNEQIAVFDFGGGTFDISILEVGDDVVEVKSTDGDSHLGGKDIDQKVLNFIADEFKKESGIDVRSDALALQRLDEAAEKAKIELSTATETEINIPFVTSDASGPRHLLMKLSRAKLEELSREFVDRAMEITKRAVEASPFKINEIEEVILVGGQTRMPMIAEAVKVFFGKEPNKSINPDEVVALGAAIQGGILAGDVKDVLLLDVIPLSLGIETMGGVATKLIEKNTTIPSARSQIFSTAADNQTSVEIHIVQGERAMAADNKSLGRFILDGIPPSPRGMPQVEVTFDIDANGILNVKAKDKTTNKEQSIRIEASSGLSKEDIEKMQKDAETNAAEDQKKKELVDAKNTAEQLAYTAEKSLKDAPSVPEDIKSGVNGKIDALKKEKESGTLESIKSATEALSAEMQKIGEYLNKQSTTDNKQEGPEVKDAEVKEEPKKEEENK